MPLEKEREIKVIAFPEVLYKRVRRTTKAEKTTNRAILRKAVTENLEKVEQMLAEAGFAPSEGPRHLVRTAVDQQIVDTLRATAVRSGVDATTLILLCLRHHFGIRLGNPERAKLLKASARRKPKAKTRASNRTKPGTRKQRP